MNERLKTALRLLATLAELNMACGVATPPRDVQRTLPTLPQVTPLRESDCSQQGIVDSYQPKVVITAPFATSRVYFTEGESQQDTGIYTVAIEPNSLVSVPHQTDTIFEPPRLLIETIFDAREKPDLTAEGSISLGLDQPPLAEWKVLISKVNTDICHIFVAEWRNGQVEELSLNNQHLPYRSNNTIMNLNT